MYHKLTPTPFPSLARPTGRRAVRVQAENTRGVQSAWSPALVVKIEENGAGKNRREGPAERAG